MKSEGLVSEECFVFADDSAGNPICMKIGGEDKESIERIYGDSFLDITDLNQLPVKLTQVVKRFLRA